MTDFIEYMLNGLSLGCIYALIAVGYTMVYGIIKLINFAHGEFYMFGAFVGYFVLILAFGAGRVTLHAERRAADRRRGCAHVSAHHDRATLPAQRLSAGGIPRGAHCG